VEGATSDPQTIAAEAVDDLRERVGERQWYQMQELAPGVTTPGWYDVGAVADRVPWPDLEGKRCLDVGTSEGFWAFEMERRGAETVVATDVFDAANWDWPVTADPQMIDSLSRTSPRKPNLDLARQALGSSVEPVELSAYELSPERIGMFDVVFCGSLLVHLRDPIRAIERIRTVCSECFVSMEPVALGLSLRHSKRPLAQLAGDFYTWWLPNGAAYRRFLEMGGFEIEASTRPFALPAGPAYRERAPAQGRRGATDARGRSLRGLPRRVLSRVVTRGDGVPYLAHRSRPV
jgi:tRNA (mo5U34)-methyltransferase